MAFNLETIVDELSHHFIAMGKVAGFREYAEKRYEELKEQTPWLCALVHKRITEIKETENERNS